jgi:hypothetical protein
MINATLATLFLSQVAAPGSPVPVADPMNLNIGRPGTITVPLNQIVDTTTGISVTPAQIAEFADNKRFVFLGENHATTPHQQLEADIVEALQKRGRRVIVGLEMLTRPVQPSLDRFIGGVTDEATFLTESDWKKQWGFDYAFYRPVLEAARKGQSRTIALNVPRDWVRTVGRNGMAGLTPAQRLQLPSVMEVGVGRHQDVFDALMGGHPATNADKILAAQTLWDEGMADTALKALGTDIDDPKVVMVIIAGSGHIMYGQGINLRVARRTGYRGVNVVMGQSATDAKVAKGLGDFVYITPEKKAEK